MQPRYDLDEQHAAFLAGIEYGRRDHVEQLAERRAHDILHERALEALGMAREYAAQKGPCWTAMIVGED